MRFEPNDSEERRAAEYQRRAADTTGRDRLRTALTPTVPPPKPGDTMSAASKDPAKDQAPVTDDAGQKAVKELIDIENEQGFRGVTPDLTPRENYTVAGVTARKPTPETTV